MKYFTKFLILLTFLLLLVGCQTREVTICFYDWDDTLLLELKLEKGETITPPLAPTREGYNFSGWDQEFSTASTNLNLIAQYEVATWTVTFKGQNNTVLKEETIAHNTSATAPAVVDPEGYTFVGWDQDFSHITSDTVIVAQFDILSFTVRFYDDLGTLLKEETVSYNHSATPPSVVDREDEEFSHWNVDYSHIIANLNVTAVFQEKEYTITFYDGANVLSLGMTTYKTSEHAILPTPTKTGYAFSGWFLSEISLYEISEISNDIKGNIKCYSRWVKTDQNQLVAPTNVGEFVQINKNLHSNGVSYVYQPQFPTGVSTTSVTAYDWASSNTQIATISMWSSISVVSPGYAIITATLKTNTSIVYYCVVQTSASGVVKATLEEANAPSFVTASFRMNDTETITKTVQKGGFAIAPTAPTKEGYTFTGWVGENQETIYNVTQNTTFVPTYAVGTKSYAGKTISILGDSITTYSGYIPSGFAYFYPYPTADLGDVNQTWWMQLINHYGMKLLVNNAWSGSAVAGDATSAAHKMNRLQYLTIGEVVPDVILILMGANDAPSAYITLAQFDAAYEEMIENIKTLAPEAEIILCTLPSIPLYSEIEQAEYTAVIDKYATQFGLTLIHFEDAFLRTESSTYLVDSAHPNKAGMDKLAEIAIRDFLNPIQ